MVNVKDTSGWKRLEDLKIKITNMSVIQFFSQSKPLPACTGAGEKKVGDFSLLDERYPNHRKMLSNFWTGSPFKVDGNWFKSIEHGLHYNKAMLFFPSRAQRYISGGDLADAEPIEVKRSTFKNVMPMNQIQLVQWNKMSEGVLADLAKAQYTQNANMRDMLIATGDAQLWHVLHGKRQRFTWLEKLRKTL